MSGRTLLIAGVLVAFLLAGFVSYYASDRPDGLEYVAGEKGFDDTAQEHAAADSPVADYRNRTVAGITGTALVLVIAGGVAYLVRRRPALG